MCVAAAMVAGLLLFALAGGADFGAGVWVLFARGKEAEERHAALVDQAIGPIWEANELWVVVSVVILWSGFPLAFAALGITLFVPLILVLAGIVIRGAFFAFQEQQTSRSVHLAFGRVFGAVSLIAPIFFGLAAGAVASGNLNPVRARTEGFSFDTFASGAGYLTSWIGPFPLAVGLLALTTCMFLSAVYLTLEATEDQELQEKFRRRGLFVGVLLAVLGLAALPVAAYDAQYLWRGLTSFPSVIFMALVAISLAASLFSLHRRSYWWARTFAILEVVLVFCAWAWAQYPYLIVSDITIYEAASPASVQVALLILSFFYAAILGPSLYLLLKIFKGGRQYGKGEG